MCYYARGFIVIRNKIYGKEKQNRSKFNIFVHSYDVRTNFIYFASVC